MNTLTAKVTKILSTPKYYRFENVSWWELDIEYDCYGSHSTMKYVRTTREEIEAITVGSEIVV